ncbi:hypothetical protein NE612_01380 [Oscillibacter valericigenes]|nr:hypothetical protein [Oscillibacter valericigenes]
MSLNEMDCIVLEDALVDLLASFHENATKVTCVPGNVITQHIFSIASARKKLKDIRENRTQDFSLQELKVMYWAVFDLREATQHFLEITSLSDPDHNTAVETQRICNRLIRDFASQFSKGGIDIHKTFDMI